MKRIEMLNFISYTVFYGLFAIYDAKFVDYKVLKILFLFDNINSLLQRSRKDPFGIKL